MTDVPPPLFIVVDDDASLLRVLAAIARDAYPSPTDLHVEAATSVDSARMLLQQAAAGPPRRVLLLSDHHIRPSLTTGAQLLHEAHDILPDAVLALMTGRDPEDLAHDLSTLPLAAFLQKPFHPTQVEALLTALVGTGRRIVPVAGSAESMRAGQPSPGHTQAA